MAERIDVEHLPPEIAFQALIDWEKQKLQQNQELTFGGGKIPDASLNSGQRTTDIIEAFIHTQDKLRILDLGAGDDCAIWTGGHNESSMKQYGTVKPIEVIQKNRDKLYVVGHSGNNRLRDWCLHNGVNEFYDGHFLDLINLLKTRGDRFDLIVSRYAIYQTIGGLQVLKGVDELLSDQGYAFLDTVGKGSGSSKVLFYPEGEEPKGRLNRSDLIRRIPYSKMNLGNLHWTVNTESEDVAWQKNGLLLENIPQLKRIAQMEDDYSGNPYRAIYTVTETKK